MKRRTLLVLGAAISAPSFGARAQRPLPLVAVLMGGAENSEENRPRIAAFRGKAEMVLDQEVDQAYPARWIGKVTVQTADGRTLEGRVDEPKGDPGNTLSREELEERVQK